MNLSENYLESTRKIFLYYESIGRKAIEQLDDESLHFRMHPEDNNIATIVKHMAGNMRSRFTNFLTEDGEKTWRNRESEFEDSLTGVSNVLQAWDDGWKIVKDALQSVDTNLLESQVVYIRNQGHTILEAFNRQLAHYAYHTGQIVFLAKSIRGESWNSLSIPKGKSNAYNEKKFEQTKSKGFFADEFIQEE